jgi:hypothetical protein
MVPITGVLDAYVKFYLSNARPNKAEFVIRLIAGTAL